MKKTEIIENIKARNIELYIGTGRSEHFSSPEIYPAYYRVLFDALLQDERPPYLVNDVIHANKDEINSLNNTMDRYLFALFPSKYEAANPIELSDSEANDDDFVVHLRTNYSRFSESGESIKIDRDKKFIKEIARLDNLPEGSKSALYKIINTIMKASIINNKWRGLISAKVGEKESRMDDIVNFNQFKNNKIVENDKKVKYDKAVENSALIKMVFDEIDAGRDDGIEACSQVIKQIPYYYSFFSRCIIASMLSSIASGKYNLKQFTQVIQKLTKAYPISENLAYRNPNQELKDKFLLGMLKNIEMNTLHAKKHSIEELRSININITNLLDWIAAPSNDEHTFYTFNEISDVKISVKDYEKAKILRDILIKDDMLEPHCSVTKMKIATIIIANVKKWSAKNKTTGGDGKTYSLNREFDNFCKHVETLDRPFDKIDLTRLRPTTQFLLSSLFRKLIWELDNEIFPKQKEHISCEDVLFQALDLTIETLDQLDCVNHLSCINYLEPIAQCASNLEDTIHNYFWADHGDPEMHSKLEERKKIKWSPTELLK
jgi:hypothetical protein